MERRATSRCEAGFSLVELMIAVALGLIILAALTAFFVQTSDNRRELDRNTTSISGRVKPRCWPMALTTWWDHPLAPCSRRCPG